MLIVALSLFGVRCPLRVVVWLLRCGVLFVGVCCTVVVDVSWLLFVCCCALFGAGCLWLVVCCVLCVVCCLLLVGYCLALMVVGCRLRFGVICCLLFGVWCLSRFM